MNSWKYVYILKHKYNMSNTVKDNVGNKLD